MGNVMLCCTAAKSCVRMRHVEVEMINIVVHINEKQYHRYHDDYLYEEKTWLWFDTKDESFVQRT